MRRLIDRRLLAAAYAVYLAAVAYLVLSPRPDVPGGAVVRVTDLLDRVGFHAVTMPGVEVGLNVVLFVPLGLLGMLLWPRLPWWGWGPVGLALSGFLEGFQWAFLPSRSPTASDLLANTGGALLGAGVVALVLRELHAERLPETSEPPAVRRRHLVRLGLVCVLAAAVLVWTPTAELPTTLVRLVSELVGELGAPAWLASTTLWERLLNVLLFVPFGVLAALARPGWSLVRWAAVGLAGSVVIELVQAAVFPDRDASVSDLITNTAGMVLGAWLTQLAVRRLPTRRR